MKPTVVFVCVILGLGSVTEACFPSKYWISCLIDTCKLGGSCPGDPTAMCRMNKTECNGCRAVWYNKFGDKANCSAKRDLQLCPGGESVVHCKVDPCQWPCDHPNFKNVPCQKKYCGKCAAEYLVDGFWSQCPSTKPSDAGSMLPIDTVLNPQTVVGNCRMVPCNIEVCISQRCPAVTAAVCRPFACNECKPMWYLDGMPVDCQTGAFIKGLPQVQQPLVRPQGRDFPPFQRTCRPGESHVPCGQRACDGQICRNYPNAICRPDGCGTCKATWYLEDKLVDCFSDQCPANVPFVRCVDDPCKYFSHYCPTAECRASQCGKCEAKFFVNGNEIDCVMPPKSCPVGVDPSICPWFTCPANICPSNSRLMCRINPCGSKCTHEWIDIYNGETRTCRTFDKQQSPTKQTSFKQPESNRIFFKDPLLNIIDPTYSDAPLFVDRKSAKTNLNTMEKTATRIPQTSMPSLNMIPKGEFVQHKSAGFRIEPVFVNPSPPIRDTDLLALLRSFPHEVSVVSSSAIKNALKKPVSRVDQHLMSPEPSFAQTFSQPKRNFIGLNVNKGAKQNIVPNVNSNMAPELKPVLPAQPTQRMVPMRQAPLPQLNPHLSQTLIEPKIIELQPSKPKNQPKAPKHQSFGQSVPNTHTVDPAMAIVSDFSKQPASVDFGHTVKGAQTPFVEQQAAKPFYPEMAQTSTNLQTQHIAPTEQATLRNQNGVFKPKPKKVANQVSQNNGGVPITMNLFSQWGNMPL